MSQRDEFLLDVFTTAIEGGTGYWLTIDEYHWADVGNEWFAVGDAVDDWGDGEKGLRIDRKVITRGIGRAYVDRFKFDEYQFKAIVDLNWGKWDDLDYDAITADIVVQYGLFGELVFG